MRQRSRRYVTPTTSVVQADMGTLRQRTTHASFGTSRDPTGVFVDPVEALQQGWHQWVRWRAGSIATK